jgi:hypothetical protein
MTKPAILSAALVAMLAGAQWTLAQTGNAPCGIDVIRAGKEHIDDRFIPFPPDHVKFALVRAFPDVGWKITKDEGFHLRGEKDMGLTQVLAHTNSDEGVKGRNEGVGALGKWTVDITEATQDGVYGSHLHVDFRSNKFVGRAAGTATLAEPLGSETACLATLLSTNNPSTHPRGLEIKDAGPRHAVSLPDATPLKVLLRDPLYSKKLDKDSSGQTVQFEVAEDVVVDGAIVIRRGALAQGHFTDVEKTKMGGRHAEISFVFDTVTAVDGQNLPVSGASEQAKGGRHSDKWANVAQAGAFGFLAKGTDALIPAGTSFDLEVSGQHTVQGGS